MKGIYSQNRVSFLRRFLSFFIDMILSLMSIICIIIAFTLFFSIPSVKEAMDSYVVQLTKDPQSYVSFWSIFKFIAAAIYSTIFLLYFIILLWKYKGTIGMRVMNIKLTTDSGSSVNIKQVLIREISLLGPPIFYAAYNYFSSLYPSIYWIDFSIFTYGYVVINCVMTVFNRNDNKHIPDYLAKTHVILRSNMKGTV